MVLLQFTTICQKRALAFPLIFLCLVSITQPLYVLNKDKIDHQPDLQVLRRPEDQLTKSTSSSSGSGGGHDGLVGTPPKGAPSSGGRDNHLLFNTKTPGANQRAVHRKRRHHHYLSTTADDHHQSESHLVTKRESGEEESKNQQLCNILLSNATLHQRSPLSVDDSLFIDPFQLGNQCWLHVRIKHPLFKAQKSGLVAGIQYHMDLSLYGLCNEAGSDGLQPMMMMIFGVYSKYGSLQGGPRVQHYSNCSSSADILLVPVKPDGSVTRLAYIPSERSHDEIRFATKDFDQSLMKGKNVHRTINLSVINECLLALSPRAFNLESSGGGSKMISMTDLLVPVLQTQFQGWPFTPNHHSCLYSLPEAFYYSIKATNQGETAECHVLLQFLANDNILLPLVCLSQIKAIKATKVKISIVGYATGSHLLESVRDYQLVQVGQPRLARHSNNNGLDSCSGDLVKFEDKGLHAAVATNYNYHSGDCVAKLHLPYGFATQLQFKEAISSYDINADQGQRNEGHEAVLAMPNCSYTLARNLAFVEPTNQMDVDDGLTCYIKANYLTLETNQVTIRWKGKASHTVWVKGHMLPHLVGNCKQDDDIEDLWLQMGAEHCIKIHRSPKSWIKAEQLCGEQGQYHKGHYYNTRQQHLISIHNGLDEKLVQNLVLNSPHWKAESGIWIGASDTKQEGNFMWTDSSKMDYKNWFPGWAHKYGAEPSSKSPSEDCVELRQSFPGLQPDNEVLIQEQHNEGQEPGLYKRQQKLYWSDQECRQENWFICSRPMIIQDEISEPKPLLTPSIENCSVNIQLTRENPVEFISHKSESHKLSNCTYQISAFDGGEIIVEFQEFLLAGVGHGENADCLDSDRVVIEQKVRTLGTWRQVRRFCGDWNGQLKSLHVVTKASGIRLGSVLSPMHKDEKRQRGFVAKIISTDKLVSIQLTNISLVEGTSGHIESTNFPKDYLPLRTQTTHIVGPKGTQIRLRFQNISLEASDGCKYDSVVVSDTKNVSLDRSARICGVIDKQDSSGKSVFTYESHSNELWVVMTSDETVSSAGYYAHWEALPVLKCANKTFRGVNSGYITSPGYPDEESSRFDPPLDCWVTIMAPVDHRIVLSLETLDFDGDPANESLLLAKADCGSAFVAFWLGAPPDQELCLGLDKGQKQQPRRMYRRKKRSIQDLEKTKYSLVANGSNYATTTGKNYPELVSFGSKLTVRFFSQRGRLPGRGFRARFKIESFQFTHSGPEFKVDNNSSDEQVEFVNINHPLEMPRNLKYRTTMTSPSGTNLQLILPVKSAQQNCSTGNFLQIEDPYRSPSKVWQFCNFSSDIVIPEDNKVMLQSYLNMLKVTQITNGVTAPDMKFKIKVKAVVDEDVVQKVLQLTKDKEGKMVNNSINNYTATQHSASAVSFIPMGQPGSIGTCDDNLCFNGGFCDPITLKCKCVGHFIGRYCLQTMCDLQPCQNGGLCSLTSDGYVCSCPRGFGGLNCKRRLRPCSTEPCVNGICIEDKTKTDGYRCQCHLWWIGPTCERRIKNIPFKPLSERMMEEPFWLGLLAVFVVLGILGTGFMLKKHLPEKFDRLFAEGQDGDKGGRLGKNYGQGSSGHAGAGGSSSTILGHSTFAAQTSLSEAADAILGISGDEKGDGRRGSSAGFDTSPGAVAKHLLGKFTNMRKASILSGSSIGSFGDKKSNSSTEELHLNGQQKKSPRKSISVHEEERRKILKMLVTPQATKRTVSSASFDSMVIKAARSAENINNTNCQVTNGLCSIHDNSIIRKESSSSLQIPGLLRRANSDSGGKVSSVVDHLDPNSKKVVTFSQVVDEMACSFSESSSMSDLSSCTEDFKHSVSAHVPRRTSRKLLRSSRISKRNQRAQQIAGGYFGRTQPLGNTSGSEDLYESSMESIESNNANCGLTLHPLSALNSSASSATGLAANGKHKLHKISSADSIMSMIKNLASNHLSTSTPSSPQLSDYGDGASSGFPTPLTTPDTPCTIKTLFSPRSKDQHKLIRKISASELGAASASSSPSMSPTRSSSQIMVEVLDPLNPRKDQDPGDKSLAGNPTITLEVPAFSFGKCLSPIKELPSPMPTPIPSPIPFQRISQSLMKASQDETSSSSSSSGKSTPSMSKKSGGAGHLLSSRRSSFTAFCKKAANAGRSRRSSTAGNITIKSSMSTSDDEMIPMQELNTKNKESLYNEISISVPPIIVTKPNIPIIMLTEPDDDDIIDDDDDEEEEVKVAFANVPQIAVSPPSPRPIRRDFVFKIQEEDEEDSSEVIEEESEELVTIKVDSPPMKKRAKPPPLTIENSTFLNFTQNEEEQMLRNNHVSSASQNVSQDAMSKPDPSSVMTIGSSSRMAIELGERRSKTPNDNHDTSVKMMKHLVKQKDISEERKCLFKQSSNVSDEDADPKTDKVMDSPKFLIPPGKFDSTPRSRSQSVELPEFMLEYGIRKMSLNPGMPMIEARINVIPPSPIVYEEENDNRSSDSSLNKDEGLAAYMRSRSGQSSCSSGSQMKTSTASWSRIKLGSPPAKKALLRINPDHGSGSVTFGPSITITPMSELESDAESSTCPSIVTSSTSGMHYLSPFTIITTCASRTTSESNLSSSGYSSMASPGPSRSGSSNPLCISESEDTSTPTKTSASFFPRLLVPGSVCSRSSGGTVVIRRPSTLLKSPSADSESSDPISKPVVKTSTCMMPSPGERRLLMASRYRTDSETTDEQCIPESIHDSAIDSTEDIVEEIEEDDCSEVVQAPKAVCTALEVQSSTESDKTVLSSTGTVLAVKEDDKYLSSVPNSPGVMFTPRSASSSSLNYKRLCLNLPEIVVQPCSPPPTSPSADSSPTGVKKESSSSTASSSSSISLGLALATIASSSSSSSSSAMKKNQDHQGKVKLGAVKSSSVPPLLMASTSIEYEQMRNLMTTASAPISASSSRSESPQSDRYCGKCSSLISLHLRTIESDGGLEYSSEVRSAATQTRPQSKQKRRVKRPSSSRSPKKRLESTNEANVASSPRKLAGKRLLLRTSQSKVVDDSTSSNESIYSTQSVSSQARGKSTNYLSDDHSSSDESGEAAAGNPLVDPVTSPPASSPSSSSLKASSSSSKQGSPSGSTLGLLLLPSAPVAASKPSRPQISRPKRRSTSKSALEVKNKKKQDSI